MRQHRLRMRWISGVPHNTSRMEAHGAHVITTLQFDNDYIVTGSDDNTVKVCGTRCAGRLDRKLPSRHGLVTDPGGCCRYPGLEHADQAPAAHHHGARWRRVGDAVPRQSACHRCDGPPPARLRPAHGRAHPHAHRPRFHHPVPPGNGVGFNAAVFLPKKLGRLTSPASSVKRLRNTSQMRDNVLVSGSRDTTLRVWDLDTGACRHVMRGHSDSVRCLALHGSYAISGSYDHTVRVWNYQTGTVRQRPGPLLLGRHRTRVDSELSALFYAVIPPAGACPRRPHQQGVRRRVRRQAHCLGFDGSHHPRVGHADRAVPARAGRASGAGRTDAAARRHLGVGCRGPHAARVERRDGRRHPRF